MPSAFNRQLSTWFRQNRRGLPWRDHPTPYGVVVSEVMLQQTQVPRVIPKYEEWMRRFPSFESLAQAPLADVLTAWQGLGYNRRAKFLHQLAQIVAKNGELPTAVDDLEQLPGIGPATARSIAAFAFDEPTVFIETNVRSVFLHYFFPDQAGITDRELLPLIEKELDREHPREWYSALMDYGTFLKTQQNPSRRSAHHTTQSRFTGSRRQVRGAIIRALTVGPKTDAALNRLLTQELPQIRDWRPVADDLAQEGLIVRQAASWKLPR